MDTDGTIAISVEQAAKRLSIGRDTAYELIHAKKIPAIRLGRRYVVPVLPLEAAFNSLVECTAAPKPAPRRRNGRR